MSAVIILVRSLSRSLFSVVVLVLLIPSTAAMAADSDDGSATEKAVDLADLADTTGIRPFVFGGEPVNNPGWIASVVVDGFYSCTASLIHPQWVLTAAHCADSEGSTYEVVVGGTRWYAGTERNVVGSTIHPDWDSRDLSSVDLALLELSSPITGAPLPDLAATATWPRIGQTVIVAGWGETYNGSPIPDYLRGAAVTVNSDYTGVPSSSIFCYPAFVAASDYEDFCFGTATAWACPGDSGGPLVGRATPSAQSGAFNTIYGVTSFGGAAGCSSFDEPVGQPVGPHIGWIRSIVPQPSSPGEGDEMFFYRADGLHRFYDVSDDAALGKPIRAGDDYTHDWSTITGIDLDGDSLDEMFFYRDDGLFRFYDIRPNGSLGSPVRAGDSYTAGWDSITAIDLEGDGQDEMFFYRDDGLYRFYDIGGDGRIGSPILAGDEYTSGWDSISAIDMDGDGQDEMFFYRDDGLYRFYDIRPDGSLPRPIRQGSSYTKDWSSITAIDLEGDGQDEMFFYRTDGLFRFYDLRPDGTLPGPIRSGDGYTKGWTSITSVNLAN